MIFESQLQNFKFCSLDEMDAVKLMDRKDSKYLLSDSERDRVIEFLRGEHHILRVQDKIAQCYNTLYLDGPQHSFFLDHSNSRPRRQKVRIRQYQNSQSAFLEVKHKRTEIGTSKVRQPWTNLFPSTSAEERQWNLSDSDRIFLESQGVHNKVELTELRPTMWTNFSRITFVNFAQGMRITLDLDLQIGPNLDQLKSIQGLSILEIKKPKGQAPAPIFQKLREMGKTPMSWSKYCMACAYLIPGLKTNKFREQMRKLNKLGGFIDG